MKQDEAVKILKCPYCAHFDRSEGRAISIVNFLSSGPVLFAVECGDCWLRGPTDEREESAIAHWNTLPRDEGS